MSNPYNLVSGAGGGGCFRAGSRVQLEHGASRAIEKMQAGDIVLAFDENGVVHRAEVYTVHVHEQPQPLMRVRFWGGLLDVTPNHWVLNQYGAFVEIGRLTTDDALVDGMGHLRPIISMEEIDPAPVYNLTVEPHHTFICGGVRVHNGGHRDWYPIVGAGGGGGKGGGGTARAAIEDPDSLRSKQYARVLDAVCEGPIVGLVNGAKSVFLDDVPLQNPDNTYNFTDVLLATATGTQIQDYIVGFGEPQVTTAVGVQILAAVPVVRTIAAASEFDSVTVTLGFPQLTNQNTTNGDLTGTSVNIAIDVQANGGGYVEVVNDTVSGKTTTRYLRPYRVVLTGTGPWDIRVRRLTGDSSTASVSNSTWWDNYVGVIDVKMRYPNTGLVGLQVDAAQFSAIPRRSFDMKLLIVSVPSNYNPTTRVYTGTWDGTFTPAWTDNPAWCFYDLLTNNRYGLGEFIEADQVNKWQLYSIAQYCDQLVGDGYGGMEPRFTCNLYLQTRAEAYTVLSNFVSIFRAINYWASGTVITVQDKPSSPIAIYTNANVIEGEFNYSGASRRGRHTVALVTWNDPLDYYRQKIEYVADEAGIARYGVQQAEIVAMGCTSRGQAHRLGKWLLESEISELETCTWKVGLDGTGLYPGAIVKTVDKHRSGVRLGGRLISATTISATIDAAITLTSGIAYTITMVLPDGTLASQSLTNAPGSVTVLTWATALASAPLTMSVWLVAADNVVPETWRIIGLTEIENLQIAVTALQYDENKFYNAENNIKLAALPTSTISLMQGPVASVAISESLYIKGDSITSKMTIAWPPATGAKRYLVEYKRNNDNWVQLPDQTTLSADVDIDPGIVYARVTAFNVIGTPSSATNVGPITILGKTAPPPNIDTFLVSRQPDGTRQFTWELLTPPLDLAGYHIRYKLGTGATWDTMTALHNGLLVASPFESNQLAAGQYDFAIKAVDTTGNVSVNAKFINLTIGDPRLAGVLEVFNEWNDGWPGTKTSCHVESPSGYIQPNESAATPWVRTWAGAKWIITPANPIIYERKIDVGVVTAFTPLVTFTGDGTPTVTEAHSNDDITYTAYAASGSLITARYVKIKVSVAGAWAIMRDLQTILSATPVEEDIEDKATSTLTGSYRIAVGDIRLPITKTYAVIRKVDVTLQNVGAGWSWELVDKNTAIGPRIKIYNASNVLADAIIDATVRGL